MHIVPIRTAVRVCVDQCLRGFEVLLVRHAVERIVSVDAIGNAPSEVERVFRNLAESEEAGAVVVGNYYQETIERLKKASAKQKAVVDLARLNRDLVSGDNYDGICW